MAKRNKSNIEIHYGLSDFYKYYKKEYNNPVSYSIYSNIIKEINQFVSDAMIYEGYEFNFPNLRFTLAVVKNKHKIRLDKDGEPIIKWLPTDYQATKKLWKELYPDKTEEEILQIKDRPRVINRNKHTNGYVYKWYFNKFSSNCINKSVYYFDTTRTNARNLAKYIKDKDFKDIYFEL